METGCVEGGLTEPEGQVLPSVTFCQVTEEGILGFPGLEQISPHYATVLPQV